LSKNIYETYGNPFLIHFKDAVIFKANYAIFNQLPMEKFLLELQAKYTDDNYCRIGNNLLEDPRIADFLFPSKNTIRQSIEIFDHLTELVAILAFHQGGIDIFGWHFEFRDDQFLASEV
jgi:hypothetical protein